MAINIKNLASGTLNSTSLKTLAPVAGKAWLVKSVILTNRDAVSRTVDVKVTGTSPSTVAYVAPPAMAMAPSTTVILDQEVTIQYPSGGTQEILTLQLGAIPTTGIDYVLNGVERDLS